MFVDSPQMPHAVTYGNILEPDLTLDAMVDEAKRHVLLVKVSCQLPRAFFLLCFLRGSFSETAAPTRRQSSLRLNLPMQAGAWLARLALERVWGWF